MVIVEFLTISYPQTSVLGAVQHLTHKQMQWEQKPEWMRSAAAKADAIGEQQVKQIRLGFISNETVDCLLRFDTTISVLNYCEGLGPLI